MHARTTSTPPIPVGGAAIRYAADAIASDNAQFMDAHVNVGLINGVESTALAWQMPLANCLTSTCRGPGSGSWTSSTRKVESFGGSTTTRAVVGM